MAQWQTPRCYLDHQHGILGSGPRHDGAVLSGGPSIVGGNLAGNVYDNANYTWREYGQRVGVWRLFDIFDAEGVPASCTMNGKMALERRPVVDAALERGWEIVLHNFVQTELLTDHMFDEDTEREVIRTTPRHLRAGLRKESEGLAFQFPSVDPQHDRHSRGGRSFLYHGSFKR